MLVGQWLHNRTLWCLVTFFVSLSLSGLCPLPLCLPSNPVAGEEKGPAGEGLGPEPGSVRCRM